MAKPGAMDLSVVIVSWNTRELLRECLSSLIQHTTALRMEVFVVDNASNDESAEMVRTAFPRVHLITNSVNVGFARANNQAISLALGRYVALLNPQIHSLLRTYLKSSWRSPISIRRSER